jgi:putative DNA primase/helicase
MEMVAEFRRAMEQAGIPAPDQVVADGRIYRFPTNGNRTDMSGWYLLHDDGLPAGAFGDWRSGISETWSGRSDTTLNPHERAELRQRLESVKRQKVEEERRRHAEAATEAERIWKIAERAPDDHPYLSRKKVKSNGLRIHEGRLVVPVMDLEGKLHSLQFIDGDGEKRFLPGGRVAGCFYRIGDGRGPFCLAEGVATAQTLYEATGLAVIVAFHAGNLLAVAQAIRRKYPEARILVCGDNDKSGVGQAKAREAATAVDAIVVLPNEIGTDWNDVATAEGLETVSAAVTRAENAIRAYRTDPLHESNFAPIRACDLLAETPEPIEYILDEYLAVGSLVLIAGKPKEGKTTLTYEAAVNIAQGRSFLGRATRQCGVLILAVEEHRRDVRTRLHNQGAASLENLYLCIGPLSPNPTFFANVQRFVQSHGVKLIVIDTLAAFWHVENENDASEMTRAVKPLLQLARESGACVLLIHHARKSDGSHGDEIRGSGALFGLVDVALVMKRHAVENQRLLQAQSRYPETPSELVLELRDTGYVALGDPASVGKAAKLEKLISALSESWEEAEPITTRAGLSKRDGYRLLGFLVDQGKALRDGEGKKGHPFLFRRNSIHATPQFLRHETNHGNPNSIRATPPMPAQIEMHETDKPNLSEEVNLDA